MVEIRRSDTLRQWVEERSNRDGWASTLGWATAGGAAAVVLARLVHMLALEAHPVVAISAVSLVAAAAVACLAGLVWAAWQLRLGTPDTSPFVLALGISLVTIGICTEAFAGVTALLWREGVLATAGPHGLWRTEEYYLWHLVDSIPLLDVQEGFQWPEPLAFGVAGGGLLLAYKVFLIAPLLQIAIGSYRSLTRHFLEKEAKAEDLVRRNVLVPSPWRVFTPVPTGPRRQFGRLPSLLALPLVPAIPVCIGLLVMPLVFEPGAGLDAVVSGWLAGSDLAFLRTAPQWIAAAFLVTAVGGLMSELWDMLDYMPVRRGADVVLTVGLWLAVIGFVILAAAAVNLVLLHIGLASPARPFPPGEQVRTTLAGFTSHIAAALPGPDIPGTLGWSAPPGYTDRWSSVLVLLSKAAVVGILVVPVARALLAYELHARPRTAKPVVDAGGEFVAAFRTARAAVDTAAETDTGRSRFNAQYHAAQATALATAKLDDVVALFGSGEISQKADAAVGALNRRREAEPHGLRGYYYDEHLRTPRELRADERRLLRSFQTAAGQALQRASEEIRPTKPAQP